MSEDTLHATDGGDTAEAPPAGNGVGTGPRRRRPRLAVLAAALAMVLVAALVAAIVTRGGDDESSTKRSSTTQPEASVAAPESTTPATATTSAPSVRPSALGVMAPFLAAAATMDDQLHTAAAAINSSGPPFTTVSAGVASAVQAADIDAVAAEIPAGLPNPLLRQTILVYSDLVSRRAAMQGFADAHTVATLANPPGDVTADDLAMELQNGHAASVRFDDDVATLRALAADTPPVTIAGPATRAAAETRLHVALVNEANNGCDSRGGEVFTELAPIVWQTDSRGTIRGIGFEATFGPDSQWHVLLSAC